MESNRRLSPPLLGILTILFLAVATDTLEYVDLSYDMDDSTLYWPWNDPVVIHSWIKLKLTNEDWVQQDNFSVGTHVGTHMDAPIHFWKHGWTLEEIPIERLSGPAVVIDIRDRAASDPDTLITKDDVTAWERQYGPIPEGAIVFQCSGWSQKWTNAPEYFGTPDRRDWQNFHFPSFGIEAAKYLIGERGVVGLAVDTLSTDGAQQQEFPMHIYHCRNNVFAIENVNDPCRIPPAGATVHTSPLRLVGASGGPARVIATWDTDTNRGTQGSVAALGLMAATLVFVLIAQV